MVQLRMQQIQATSRVMASMIRLMEYQERSMDALVNDSRPTVNVYRRVGPRAVRQGLSNTEISNLTTSTLFGNIISPVNIECPIAQETFSDDDEVIQINTCKHIFKRESLLSWLTTGSCCPLCRVNLSTHPVEMYEINISHIGQTS